MKSILVILCALLSITSFAKEFKFAKITTNDKNVNAQVYLNVDSQNNFVHLRFKSLTQNKVNTKVRSNEMAGGKVVFKKFGVDVIKISSKDFNIYTGGKLKVLYRSKIIPRRFGSKYVSLVRNGEQWELEKNGRKVTKFHFIIEGKKIVNVIFK